MATAARIGWAVFTVWMLILAIGAYGFSLGSALVFLLGAVAAFVWVLMMRFEAALISAIFHVMAPVMLNISMAARVYGVIHLTATVLISILMVWLAHRGHVAHRARRF